MELTKKENWERVIPAKIRDKFWKHRRTEKWELKEANLRKRKKMFPVEIDKWAFNKNYRPSKWTRPEPNPKPLCVIEIRFVSVSLLSLLRRLCPKPNPKEAAMTKNRNKKKRDDAVSMDVSNTKSVSEAAPQGKILEDSSLGRTSLDSIVWFSFFFFFDFVSHGHYRDRRRETSCSCS